jgi:hypothetical protein
MTEKEILKIVIDEIDVLSNYTAAEIKELYQPPLKDPKLSKFFPASLKHMFAPNLKRRIRFVKTTDLTNELFVTVKSLDQLIKKIQSYEA